MLKNTLIWIGAVALGIYAGSAALGGITKKRAPDIAAQAFPTNGFSYQELAEDAVQAEIVENGGALPSDVKGSTLTLARDAFRTEPTASNAVTILALSAKGAKKRKLMQKAVALSRRNSLSIAWMILDSGERNDLDDLLSFYDVNLRVSSASKDALIPVMVQALSDDRFLPAFQSMLLRNPPWATRFWGNISAHPPSLPNAARLRTSLIGRELSHVQYNDSSLIGNLVRYRQYEQAEDLYRMLSGHQDENSVVDAGSLNQPPTFLPFDWQVISDGDYASNIDVQRGTLDVNAVGGSSGVLARRIIKLPQTSLVLSADIDASDGNGALVEVRISCFDVKVSKQEMTIRLKTGKNEVVLPSLESECVFHWFAISGDFPSGFDQYNLSIKNISLNRS